MDSDLKEETFPEDDKTVKFDRKELEKTVTKNSKAWGAQSVGAESVGAEESQINKIQNPDYAEKGSPEENDDDIVSKFGGRRKSKSRRNVRKSRRVGRKSKRSVRKSRRVVRKSKRSVRKSRRVVRKSRRRSRKSVRKTRRSRRNARK